MNKEDDLLEGLVLIIPALNEQEAISEIVRACKKVADVIVVDDGSSDGTGELAKHAGAQVIRHEINRGYDSALESGIRAGHNLGYRYAITLDGDGQHNPTSIAAFYQKLLLGADIVCGIRDRKQRVLEVLFSWMGVICFGVKDPLSGLKGYNLRLREIVEPFNTYNSAGSELLIRAASRGALIAQVEVPTLSRKGGNSRFGSGLKVNWILTKALCKSFLIRLQSR